MPAHKVNREAREGGLGWAGIQRKGPGIMGPRVCGDDLQSLWNQALSLEVPFNRFFVAIGLGSFQVQSAFIDSTASNGTDNACAFDFF